MNQQFKQLAEKAGIHFEGVDADFQAKNASLRLDNRGGLACDAQPSLITTSNSAIPAFLSTFIDPALIEVLLAPMKAAEIVGNESKKGDWTTRTAMFPIIESTGEVSSYGDYNNSGNAGTNFNFPQRQSFHYQVTTNWGERELAEAGLARIDLANRLNIASVKTLNKYQNNTYFFGVANLQNYGLFNDPSLSAAITPTTKVAGGTGWENATGQEVIADIAKMYRQLQLQANGTVNLSSRMTLAFSPTSELGMIKPATLLATTSVRDYIKTQYPNLTVEVAPEYTTASGEFVQLIADAGDGQQTAITAFTEKLRAHPIVVALSSFMQKKSQGTWGTIVFRPFLIVGMLGV